MIHNVYAVRDTCVGAYLLPMFFPNHSAARRALSDAVNQPGASSDNMFAKHPEHFQLWWIGQFDDDTGLITQSAPEFVLDAQSLVNG